MQRDMVRKILHVRGRVGQVAESFRLRSGVHHLVNSQEASRGNYLGVDGTGGGEYRG